MPRHRFWLATGATAAACLIVLLAAMPSVVAAQTEPPASPALPQGDDLTLADGAGNVLIGLTVRPAQPGPNTVLVHVLPLEGRSGCRGRISQPRHQRSAGTARLLLPHLPDGGRDAGGW